MMELLIYIAVLVGGASLLLWIIDLTTKLLGSLGSWLLFLVVLPTSLATVIAYLGRADLVWWQFPLIVLSAPLVVSGAVFLAYILFNPFIVVAMISALYSRLSRAATATGRGDSA